MRALLAAVEAKQGCPPTVVQVARAETAAKARERAREMDRRLKRHRNDDDLADSTTMAYSDRSVRYREQSDAAIADLLGPDAVTAKPPDDEPWELPQIEIEVVPAGRSPEAPAASDGQNRPEGRPGGQDAS
jgi:hypothetical protein